MGIVKERFTKTLWNWCKTLVRETINWRQVSEPSSEMVGVFYLRWEFYVSAGTKLKVYRENVLHKNSR